MSERIGIAGGGAIASGLACVAAEHGQVVLWARRPDAATAKVERLIEKRGGVGAGNVSDLERPRRAARRDVRRRGDRRGARREGRRCCAQLGGAATNGTILATTTSALSIAALAEARPGGPERFVGLHVFNPVPKMDLIELVFPPQAGDGHARARARAVRGARQDRGRGARTRRASSSTGCCSRTCSTPSRCSRRAGWSRRRSTTAWRMGAGHPMGPLALLDYVGLDVSAAIGRSIGAAVPARGSRR